MEVCPQCNQSVNTTRNRIVQDHCGHAKCRLCLIAEENGCATCNADVKGEGPQITSKSESEDCKPIFKTTENGVIKFKHARNGFKKNEASVALRVQHSSATTGSNRLNVPVSLTDSDSEIQTTPVEVSSSPSPPITPTYVVSDLETDAVINESKGPLPIERDIKTDGNDDEKKKKRSKMIIKSHIKKICDSPLQFKCEMCNKTFKKKYCIYYHNFCGSDDKPFKCNECDRSFVTRDHFEYHLRRHSGVRPFVCDICGKNFINKPKLTRHMKIHTGDRPYVCQDCGKSYIDSSSLACHLNTHVNNRPYKCTTCNKTFTARVYLKKHKIRHKGDRPEMCEICGKLFHTKDSLKIHRQLHSKVRPFQCTLCSMSFHVKRELARHSHTHSSFKRYCCYECDIRFGRKDNLERHIRTAHLDVDCRKRPSVQKTRKKTRRLLPDPTCLEDLLSPRPTTSSEETVSTEQGQTCSECDNSSAPQTSNVEVSSNETDVMPQEDKQYKTDSHHPKFRQIIYSNFQINGNFEQIPVLETQEKTVRVSVINRALRNSSNSNDMPTTTDNEHPDTSLNMSNSNQNVSNVNSVTSFRELEPVKFTEAVSPVNDSLTASSVQQYNINNKTNENEVLEIINYQDSAKSNVNYNMLDNSSCFTGIKTVSASSLETVNCTLPLSELYSNTTLYHNFSPDKSNKSNRYSTLIIPTNQKPADVTNAVQNNFLCRTDLSPNLYCNVPNGSPFNQKLYDDVVKDLRIASLINQTHLNTRNISTYQTQSFYNFDPSIDEDLIDLTINSSFNQKPVNLTPASKSTSVLQITKNVPIKTKPTVSEGTNHVRTITKAPETTVSGNTKNSEDNINASIAAAKLPFEPRVPTPVTNFHSHWRKRVERLYKRQQQNETKNN